MTLKHPGAAVISGSVGQRSRPHVGGRELRSLLQGQRVR